MATDRRTEERLGSNGSQSTGTCPTEGATVNRTTVFGFVSLFSGALALAATAWHDKAWLAVSLPVCVWATLRYRALSLAEERRNR